MITKAICLTDRRIRDIVNAWETRGIRRVGVGGMHLVVTGIKDG